MVEPLVMQDNAAAGGYMVDGDTDKIVTLVRQARELGADLIKADPTDDMEDYHRVVEAAGDVPVLVRGGGRVDDESSWPHRGRPGAGRPRHRLRPQRHPAPNPAGIDRVR